MAAFLWLLQNPIQAQAAPLPPMGQDVVFLLDNSPSTITGVGAPDGNPSDPQDLRLRLTRFAVSALGLFTTTTSQRVGAISFAKPAEVLVPLIAVEDWARADQARIQALDMGPGTDFAMALEAAADMLAESDCATEKTCDIILISDGVFDRPTRDQQAVVAALESLRGQGIQVHLLAFALPDAQSHIIWEDLLAQGLLACYETRITSRFQQSPQDVYTLLFDILGAAGLFDNFSSLVAPGGITYEVLPYRRWVRWQIVADQSIVPVFAVNGKPARPLQSANDYSFWEGSVDGVWEIDFAEEAVVYYRQIDAALPLFIRSKPLPDSITSGEDILVQAELIVPEGVPVNQTEYFSMTATLHGPGRDSVLPLVPQGVQYNGVFTTTNLPDGIYTVTLSAAAASCLRITVPAITHTLEVRGAVLDISPILSVTPLDGLRPGDAITITLDQCQGSCEPSVLLVGDGYTRTLMLNPVGGNRYQLFVPVDQTIALIKNNHVELIYIKGASVPSFGFGIPWYWIVMILLLGIPIICVWAYFLYRKWRKPVLSDGTCLTDDIQEIITTTFREIVRVVEAEHDDFVISQRMEEIRENAVQQLLGLSIRNSQLLEDAIDEIYDNFGGTN